MKGKRMGLKDILGFIRAPNLLLIVVFFLVFDHAFVQTISSEFGIELQLTGVSKMLLILDVLIVAIIGYVANDLFDVPSDEVNRPERLLVKFPTLSPSIPALLLILILFGLGITITLAYLHAKWEWAWLFPAIVSVLLAYARRGKQWGVLGNVSVSALIAGLPWLWLIAESEVGHWALDSGEYNAYALNFLLCYTGLMFFANLGREVIKDMEDVEGDRVVGASTLPIKSGIDHARTVVAMAITLVAGSQVALFLWTPFSPWTVGFSSAVIGSVFVLFVLIWKKAGKANARRVSTGLKLLMLIGLLQMIVLPHTFF